MKVGICAYWFNRGQGVVARQLRSALEELGHETFVLGRPTKESFPMPQEARADDVWAQPGVTRASDFFIPKEELLDWASQGSIAACFFDQNYEFGGISALRSSGVRTIGRFVWERFSDEHVAPTMEAYDVVYSLTLAEQNRYLEMGMQVPHVRWGVHPEYSAYSPQRPEGVVDFHYHAGLLGRRKPFKEVVSAFSDTDDSRLRLIVKAQIENRMRFLERAARRDARVALVFEDLPTDEHLQMFADCHVCMAPARWEGLGLHLYEAIAFGMPIVCNDDPPMNELVVDGVNGLLVRSHADGLANSGIPSKTVDVPELTRAISRLADPGLRAELSAGASQTCEERSWGRTVSDVSELLR